MLELKFSGGGGAQSIPAVGGGSHICSKTQGSFNLIDGRLHSGHGQLATISTHAENSVSLKKCSLPTDTVDYNLYFFLIMRHYRNQI